MGAAVRGAGSPQICRFPAGVSRMNAAPRGVLRCAGREFHWGSRTYVMGIVNVTPDSFSGDGLGSDVEAAVRQARSERVPISGAERDSVRSVEK